MAKKMYRANNNFMFRIPTSSYTDVKTTKEELLSICRDKQFREKLLIASPSLLQMIDTYFEEPDKLSPKKIKDMFGSIEKYFRRSIERTTPFGLFAGVGIGKFDEKTSFENNQQVFQKSVYLDAGWLWEYIAKLEQTYYAQLNFKWNEVCINDGNRSLLLYTTTQDIEEISVRRTAVLKIVEETCREYTPYEVIVNKLQQKYTDVDRQVITAYLFDLIEKQILISDLRPALSDAEPLNWLIMKITAINKDIAAALTKLREMCEAYEKTPIGEGNAQYHAIIRLMKELHVSKYYLQVDTNIYGSGVTLDRGVKSQIEQLTESLVMLSTSSQKQKEALNWYRDKFVEKYGNHRLVPLTEMMDTAIGIGAPIGYSVPFNDFFENPGSSIEIDKRVRSYFLREYERAIRHNTPIKIDMDEVGKFLDFRENMNAPTSFELYFKAKKEKGKIKLYMSESGGSSCAGKTFGRFALKNQEFSDVLIDINRQEKAVRGDGITCEISHLPARLRSGNVCRCPSGRDRILSAYVGEDNTKKKLCLENILIGVDNSKFYAVDGETGEKIVFGMNNMYNLMLQPNIYRFLLEIGSEGEINCFDFPWKYAYQNLKHIPRIELEDVVLSEEQWLFSTADLKLSDKKVTYEEFQNAFKQYKKENNLPEQIYLVEEDNRISLDLDNIVSLQILFDELKKKKGTSVMLERKEGGEEIAFGSSRFPTEIVVPVFRTAVTSVNNSPVELNVIERKNHIVLPYENWLYFKLYCKHQRETELIALELKQFAQKLKAEKGIEHFFMRYMDTKPHIRLRFYGSPKMLYEATPDIMKWIAELAEKNIIGDMSINPYEREIERYGGNQLITDAEALFRADSVVVENVLWKIRMKQTVLTVEEATMLSVIKYLEAFYDDFKQRLDFCTTYYHSNQYITEFRENKEKYLALFDMENAWTGFGELPHRKELLEILNSRNSIIGEYRTHIEAENKPTVFKDDIVCSVLHLHCNRMIGTDREFEKKIMSFVESLLYAKKHLYIEKG